MRDAMRLLSYEPPLWNAVLAGESVFEYGFRGPLSLEVTLTGDPLAFLRAAQDFKPSFGSCLSRFSHLILCEYLRPILQRKCLVTAPNEASSVEDLCDFVSRIVKQSIARDSPFISADVNVVIWAIGYIERS